MLGLKTVTVTIANGAATSNAFRLDGYKIVAVATPSAWTAADISFEVDPSDATFRKAVDASGALVKITGVATSAAEYNIVPEIGDCIAGVNAKVVSTNTASEADANQGAARVLIVVLVPVGQAG